MTETGKVDVSLPLALHLALEVTFLFRLQVDMQRTLLPDKPRMETVSPITAIFRNLEVEVPHHARKDEAHLCVCKTAAIVSSDETTNVRYFQGTSALLKERGGVGEGDALDGKTLPGPVRERMEAIPAVVDELGFLAVLQPALRDELVRALEVVFATVHDSMRDA